MGKGLQIIARSVLPLGLSGWINTILICERRNRNCSDVFSPNGIRVPGSDAICEAFFRGKTEMIYKETFWMACDSTEQLRAEYGPFHTRGEAEREADRLGFGYLLRYEHIMGEDEEIQEVRCVFIELSDVLARQQQRATLHTRCATCGESSSHDEPWQAEVWADIHEFEHSRHLVRLFEHRRGTGLKEVANWRAA